MKNKRCALSYPRESNSEAVRAPSWGGGRVCSAWFRPGTWTSASTSPSLLDHVGVGLTQSFLLGQRERGQASCFEQKFPEVISLEPVALIKTRTVQLLFPAQNWFLFPDMSLFPSCSADGEYLQYPANHHDPDGSVRLQAHSKTVAEHERLNTGSITLHVETLGSKHWYLLQLMCYIAAVKPTRLVPRALACKRLSHLWKWVRVSLFSSITSCSFAETHPQLPY